MKAPLPANEAARLAALHSYSVVNTSPRSRAPGAGAGRRAPARPDPTRGAVSRLLEAGVHAYLTKPLDVELFLSTVDGALEMR